jgi:hypothetical protein
MELVQRVMRALETAQLLVADGKRNQARLFASMAWQGALKAGVRGVASTMAIPLMERARALVEECS